ncbi:hypothetical protein [Paraburkholderia kirstenboschensis]|uniref:hypothetical protein n=1 Tax=Paraburkholderia kirstenboschensis TaxID=1245436 RepID=UPI000FFC483D|nr:hypothetical protein [Paraburkholderia kirstenboschensis]
MDLHLVQALFLPTSAVLQQPQHRQHLEPSLTRQCTRASAALLQPAASNTLSPRVTSSASSAYDARRERRLIAGLEVLILIVIPLGAFIICRNRALGITTNYRRRGKKKP